MLSAHKEARQYTETADGAVDRKTDHVIRSRDIYDRDVLISLFQSHQVSLANNESVL